MELKNTPLLALARLPLPVLASGTLAAAAHAAPCEALAALTVPHTEITHAEQVPTGGFEPSERGGPGAAFLAATLAKLPAFCRVAAIARPTPDSEIGIEVWLPESGWNGRLQSVGNGAWAGTISYSALAEAQRYPEDYDGIVAGAAAIDRWVTTGKPPERIEAARVENGDVVRTRPLCPYPQVAAYDGSGSSDDSANFICR
jgi:feruloyl esterase